MRLDPDEPEAGPWRAVSPDELRSVLQRFLEGVRVPLVLVDGRSGSGKSTFAERAAALLGAAVVHTDDIAWHLHPIDWESALDSGVLRPWRSGEAVSFRPPGWVRKGRPGAVDVPAGVPLVVEGVGAARSSLAAQAELVVWVQSDRDLARERALVRDVAEGRTPSEAAAFWDEWMRSEAPFLAAERPWERAHLVVNGTASGGQVVLAPGPLGGEPGDVADSSLLPPSGQGS